MNLTRSINNRCSIQSWLGLRAAGVFRPQTMCCKLQGVTYHAMTQLCHSFVASGWQLYCISRPICQFHCVMYIAEVQGLFAISSFIWFCCAPDSPCKLLINCCLLLQIIANVIRLSSLFICQIF